MRGVQIRGGYHDFVIREGGVSVFPRLVASEHEVAKTATPAISQSSLDALLGGGLERGTSTLLMGPSGVGKSTIACTYCRAAMVRGERVLVLLFDETKHIFLARAAGLGMDFEAFADSGMLLLEQVDPAELSPGELSSRIGRCKGSDAGCYIDSLTGYLNASLRSSISSFRCMRFDLS